jgi:hypothetical protein
MNIAQLPIRFTNELLVDQFVTEIKTELCHSTSTWKRISEIFCSAQEQFGRKSKEMKELSQKTDFSVKKLINLFRLPNAKT